MKISYAITVCNEIDEIKNLLSFLFKSIDIDDEIVVLFDEANGSDEVLNFLKTLDDKRFRMYRDKFNGDFSCWKNNVKRRCVGDYIFFIDSDEMVGEWFINNIKSLLNSKKDVDLFIIPRINTVSNHSDDDVKKFNWSVNNNGWINYPDYQMRIIKNKNSIYWINKVHEILSGFKSHIFLPSEEKYSIIHNKEIKRQRKQNDLYDKLNSKNHKNDDELNIIYRVCDSVSVTSSFNQKRDFGTKGEVIIKCFESLKKSINYYNKKVNLYVVSDNLSDDIKKFILSSDIISEFIETKNSGNGNSFAECLQVALTCSGMILFLEDDYYLDEKCLSEMIFIRNKLLNSPKFKHKSICVYPLDEDRYDNPELTYVLLGNERHWKTVKQTTCTFMIDDLILKDQYDNLIKYQKYGEHGISEANTINLMYQKYPCFSPLPSLVDHLQFQNCLPPFSKFKK